MADGFMTVCALCASIDCEHTRSPEGAAMGVWHVTVERSIEERLRLLVLAENEYDAVKAAEEAASALPGEEVSSDQQVRLGWGPDGEGGNGIGTDDYPSERDLKTIADWPAEDPEGWFDFIYRCWWAPELGWHEGLAADDFGRRVYRYDISTAGWSGNERLIDAMKRNYCLWGTTWQMSRRGGHYRFEVLKEDP